MVKSLREKLEALGFEYLYQSVRVGGGTPKRPGVYCFLRDNIDEERIIYIGKSVDLSARLRPWHRIEHLESSFPFCYVLYTNDQDQVEIKLIKMFKPLYNVQHNPAISRTITYNG